MRAGYVGNTELQKFLDRGDSRARVVVEVVKTEQEDAKDVKADWDDADSLTNLETLVEGGIRLDATLETLTENTNAQTTALIDLGGLFSTPVDALVVQWAGNDAEAMEVHTLRANLDPAYGGAKEVTDFYACMFRLARIEDVEGHIVYYLEPRSAKVAVEAPGAADNVDFALRAGAWNPIVGAVPELVDGYDGEHAIYVPTSVFVIWALKDTGEAADNVAWLASADTTVTDGSGNKLSRHSLLEVTADTRAELGTARITTGPSAGCPRATIYGGTYTEATVTFTTNPLDLGAGPAGDTDLEVFFRASTPGGTSVAPQISDDGGSTWEDVADGDIIGEDNSGTGGNDLSGVARQQSYECRVTLTPSTSTLITPRVHTFGVREITSEDMDQLVDVTGFSQKVDPVTLKPLISSITISILRDGITDYRDFGTKLLSEKYIREILFRLWWGHPDLDRRYWLHHSDWIINDPENADVTVDLECVSVLSYAKKTIPVLDTGTGEREPLFYNVQEINAVWDDLLTGQMGVATRLIGPGPSSTQTITKKIKKACKGKDELDRVSFLAGGATIDSQGRFRFIDFFDGRPPVAFFPYEMVIPRSIRAGQNERITDYSVPYGWNEQLDGSKGAFDGQAYAAASDNVLERLGRALIDNEEELEKETAIWVEDTTFGDEIAQRMVSNFEVGLPLFAIDTVDSPHPHLETGDAVVVETDRLVVRDPNADRAIRGRIAARCVIVGVFDLAGTKFVLWPQKYSDILPASVDITHVSYTSPEMVDIQLSCDKDGNVKLVGTVNQESLGIKYDVDKSAYPSDADVRAEAVHGTGADHIYTEDDIIALAHGETAYVKMFAYEFADGTGSESLDPMIAKIARTSLAIPTVKVVPTQSGTTATLTVTVNDPDSRQNASSFETNTAGGDWAPDADPANWSGFDDSDPYTLVETETMHAKHGATIAWGIRYADKDAANKWITGIVTFDADLVAHAKITQITVREDGTVVFAYQGDEDTVGIYYTVDSSEPANEPDDPDAADDYVAGRKGVVVTGTTATHGETVWVKIAGKNSDNEVATGDDIDEGQKIAIIPPAIPTVKVVPTQSGTTGTVTLVVNDPDSRMNATSFEIHNGGGDWAPDADPANWSGFDDSAPYGLTQNVTLQAKHDSFVAYGVRYADKDAANKWITGVLTLDLDLIAEVTGIEITFADDGDVVVSATGDEDTANMYVKVGIDSTPANPTSGSNDGTIAGRSGSVDTGVNCAIGSEAEVKVIAYDSVGPDAGPVAINKARRGVGEQQKTIRFTPAGKVTLYSTSLPVEATSAGGIQAAGVTAVSFRVHVELPQNSTIDTAYVRYYRNAPGDTISVALWRVDENETPLIVCPITVGTTGSRATGSASPAHVVLSTAHYLFAVSMTPSVANTDCRIIYFEIDYTSHDVDETL